MYFDSKPPFGLVAVCNDDGNDDLHLLRETGGT